MHSIRLYSVLLLGTCPTANHILLEWISQLSTWMHSDLDYMLIQNSKKANKSVRHLTVRAVLLMGP